MNALPAPLEGADDPLRLEAEATVPTAHGPMRMIVFRWGGERDHVALVRGDVRGDDVLVRVHGECMRGEVFGSLACDCAERLDAAMTRLEAAGRGVVVYLRQDDRGLGLGPTSRAGGYYGHEAAAAVLRALGVRSVVLLTGDPSEAARLRDLGVHVRARLPLAARPPVQTVPSTVTSANTQHFYDLEGE